MSEDVVFVCGVSYEDTLGMALDAGGAQVQLPPGTLIGECCGEITRILAELEWNVFSAGNDGSIRSGYVSCVPCVQVNKKIELYELCRAVLRGMDGKSLASHIAHDDQVHINTIHVVLVTEFGFGVGRRGESLLSEMQEQEISEAFSSVFGDELGFLFQSLRVHFGDLPKPPLAALGPLRLAERMASRCASLCTVRITTSGRGQHPLTFLTKKFPKELLTKSSSVVHGEWTSSPRVLSSSVVQLGCISRVRHPEYPRAMYQLDKHAVKGSEFESGGLLALRSRGGKLIVHVLHNVGEAMPKGDFSMGNADAVEINQLLRIARETRLQKEPSWLAEGQYSSEFLSVLRDDFASPADPDIVAGQICIQRLPLQVRDQTQWIWRSRTQPYLHESANAGEVFKNGPLASLLHPIYRLYSRGKTDSETIEQAILCIDMLYNAMVRNDHALFPSPYLRVFSRMRLYRRVWEDLGALSAEVVKSSPHLSWPYKIWSTMKKLNNDTKDPRRHTLRLGFQERHFGSMVETTSPLEDPLRRRRPIKILQPSVRPVPSIMVSSWSPPIGYNDGDGGEGGGDGGGSESEDGSDDEGAIEDVDEYDENETCPGIIDPGDAMSLLKASLSPHMAGRGAHNVVLDNDNAPMLPVVLPGLAILRLGSIQPNVNKSSNDKQVYPIGYCAARLCIRPEKEPFVCYYEVGLTEDGDAALFSAHAMIDGKKAYAVGTYCGHVARTIMRSVYDAKARAPGVQNNATGPEIFGVASHVVRAMIEDMPGIENCRQYLRLDPFSNINDLEADLASTQTKSREKVTESGTLDVLDEKPFVPKSENRSERGDQSTRQSGSLRGIPLLELLSRENPNKRRKLPAVQM